MNHPIIVHLCNVKEVAPSKRLNSKALIYLFYLFLSWFHNSTSVEDCGSRQGVYSVYKKLQERTWWSSHAIGIGSVR